MSSPPRRTNSLVPLAALVLALAAAAFISVEVLNRRKFATFEQEITAAVADIRSQIAPARFRITKESGRQGSGHWLEWPITPPEEVGSTGPHSGRYFEIRLSQARTGILHAPTIPVTGEMGRDERIERVINAALSARGLTCFRGFPLE
jgi:hypothetical protein